MIDEKKLYKAIDALKEYYPCKDLRQQLQKLKDENRYLKNKLCLQCGLYQTSPYYKKTCQNDCRFREEHRNEID